MGAVYTQLSLQERRKIESWWHAKVPVREMARVLKRHKSTIFREIKRNFWADDAFPKKYAGDFGHAAQLQTDKRRSVQRKLIRHPELCKTVIARTTCTAPSIPSSIAWQMCSAGATRAMSATNWPSPTTGNASSAQRTRSRAACPASMSTAMEYPDGRLEFRWKGVALPYSVFDKDQRVIHAAITENKHLSAELEHIKAEQDKTPPKTRRAGKQRTRYKPSGRRNDGWNSLADRTRIADRKASQGCYI